MNHDKSNDDPISRIEVSVKNSQTDIRKLFLHSTRHEIAIESLEKKMDKRFDQQDIRLDKIEELLIQIVNNLAGK